MPFEFQPPSWANQLRNDLSAEDALQRARDLAHSYYALATQTGIHSMIEWCGVMGEYVRALEAGHLQGIDPREVNQHSSTRFKLPQYMVSYLGEKLGCQLKPMIQGDPETWRAVIEKWFV